MHWFYFSSRRRHTRSLCDWSSDVCSSDLDPCACRRGARTRIQKTAQMVFDRTVFSLRKTTARSEERRVGKECRSRWSANTTMKYEPVVRAYVPGEVHLHPLSSELTAGVPVCVGQYQLRADALVLFFKQKTAYEVTV